jgi:alkylhydroperoxidase family enzyme
VVGALAEVEGVVVVGLEAAAVDGAVGGATDGAMDRVVVVRPEALGAGDVPPLQLANTSPVTVRAGPTQIPSLPMGRSVPPEPSQNLSGKTCASRQRTMLTMPGDAEPRIAPLPPDEWDDRLRTILEASPGGTEEPMHIFATLARAPELFRRWMGFGGALLYGSLPSRLTELAILRTAYRFDGFYEWAQHVEMGQERGVTIEEMTALGGDTAALDAVEWAPLERAVLRAVDETRDLGAVSDATWAELARHLDDAGLIELLMLIAHYLMLTTVLRSLRMQPEDRALAQARLVPGGPES